MEIISAFIWIINLISAASIVLLVLLQHGKGADAGAAFGSGASGSFFGSAGSANFLSRSTAIAASIFFVSCLALAYLNQSDTKQSDLGVVEKQNITAPVPAMSHSKKDTAPKIPE
jgi:preprotein translocase subunit SecG